MTYVEGIGVKMTKKWSFCSLFNFNSIVTTGKIRNVSKPAKLQSIVYRNVRVSHKQLIVTLHV